MANINEFAYALNSSARPNQFKISITFPSIVSGGQDAMRSGTYLVKAGTIPEVTIEDVQVFYRGRQYHEAGEKTFQPWTCSIYNSGDFKIRKALERRLLVLPVRRCTSPRSKSNTLIVTDRSLRVIN